VATTQIASIAPCLTLRCSDSQSIQRSRLARRGAGSSSDESRTPGTSSASPRKRSALMASPGPTIGRSTSPPHTDRQRSDAISAISASGRSASDPTSAALIAPTLVPQTIDTRSARRSSAGSRIDSAPAS
jgi:hypothetical protein